MRKVPENLDYRIVLGAHVNGTRLSRALRFRVEKAEEYLRENPRTLAVLSGGRGVDEKISEAKAMADYLLAHGIERERLLLEERSVSTAENLRFSLELLPDRKQKIGIVTNNFHIFRSVAIGRKLGCEKIWGLAAPYPSWKLLWYSFREVLAIVKDKIVGNW